MNRVTSGDVSAVTPDQELWAMALVIVQHHGDSAPAVIAERIGHFTLEGDYGSAAVWLKVAERYDQMQGELEGPRWP